MIRGYFGVPGCGKTTLLVKIARDELKKIKKGKSSYKEIYTINFECDGTKKIKWEDLANCLIEDALILIDEITLNADNRKYMKFSDEHRDFFILHRHLNVDIMYATQNFEAVDSKIRYLTQDLWYLSKSVAPILNRFTSAKRIYRTIKITENNADLIFGYRFCNFVESVSVSNFKLINRNKYYKYFNSYDRLNIENRPVLNDWVEIKEKNKIEYLKEDIKNIKVIKIFRKGVVRWKKKKNSKQ